MKTNLSLVFFFPFFSLFFRFSSRYTCIKFKSYRTCLEKRIRARSTLPEQSFGGLFNCDGLRFLSLRSTKTSFSQPQELVAIGSNGVKVAFSWKVLGGGECRFPSSVVQQHSHQRLHLLRNSKLGELQNYCYHLMIPQSVQYKWTSNNEIVRAVEAKLMGDNSEVCLSAVD